MSGSEKAGMEMDGLDRLMQEYERQAQADCRAVTEAGKKKPQTADERRTEALERPLSRDNRGYQLLTKLGYAEGEGLGVRRQGRPEPVPLPLKRRREGLGQVERKRPSLAKPEASRKREEAEEGFRNEVASRLTTKKTEKRLKATRRLIEDLDTRQNLERNPFWLPEKTEDGEDTLQTLPTPQAFSAALAYLREQHFYCLWCGHHYEDAKDMEAACPGLEEEEH